MLIVAADEGRDAADPRASGDLPAARHPGRRSWRSPRSTWWAPKSACWPGSSWASCWRRPLRRGADPRGLECHRRRRGGAARAAAAQGRELALQDDPARPVRLPIDRAFQLRGLGWWSPAASRPAGSRPARASPRCRPARPVKVRGIQVHGQSRERADAGERTALQLAGVEVGELERGEQLVEEGPFAASKVLCAEIELLPEAPPLAGVLPVRLHLFASEVPARLRPLARSPSRRAARAWSRSGPASRWWRSAATVSWSAASRRRRRWEAANSRLPLAPAAGQGSRSRARRKCPAAAKPALELWVAEGAERGAAAEELAPRLGERPAKIAAELAKLGRGRPAAGHRKRPQQTVPRPQSPEEAHREGQDPAQGLFPRQPDRQRHAQGRAAKPPPAAPGPGARRHLPRLAPGLEGAGARRRPGQPAGQERGGRADRRGIEPRPESARLRRRLRPHPALARRDRRQAARQAADPRRHPEVSDPARQAQRLANGFILSAAAHPEATAGAASRPAGNVSRCPNSRTASA